MKRPGLGLAIGFSLVTLLSAFLVFQVQPVISKCILPWFGGSPAVWTTCMLFFQVVLFGGYAYAHILVTRLSLPWQGVVHYLLLVAALCVLPITPNQNWKPTGLENPTWQILLILGANVGLPYFLLSATGPLLQAWFSRTSASGSAYRLYALSNIGSLAALLTYPSLVEPALPTTSQGSLWSAVFCLFAVLCAYLSTTLWRLPSRSPNVTGESPAPDITTPESASDKPPSMRQKATWLLLPGLASIALLATTNHVCQDVAVIPFLWIAPLALYLLTFIICFDREHWYSRPYVVAFTMLSILGICFVVGRGILLPLVPEILVYFAAMFCICLMCHGELVKSKPPARYLTSFYLLASAGGAAGGIFVGLICPLVFRTFYELHLSLMAALTLAYGLACLSMCHGFLLRPQRRFVAGLLYVALMACVFPLPTDNAKVSAVAQVRNFYGTLKVDVASAGNTMGISLLHGRIIHGFQFADSERLRFPTTYYSNDSGVGLTLKYLRHDQPLRVGAVGLGAGTVSAYGCAGDCFRFYEINEAMVEIAQQRFEFLSSCPAEIQIQLGDARLSLEREPPQHFNVIVLDAFSGDSIPAHLLTKEAFSLYRSHLQPNGVIAVHVSNRNLRLEPVVLRQAENLGMKCVMVVNGSNPRNAVLASKWMLISNNQEFLTRPEIASVSRTFGKRPGVTFPLWTDQHYNLLQILKVF